MTRIGGRSMNDATPPIEALVEADLARDYLGYAPIAIAIHLLAAALMLLPLQPGATGVRWFAAYLLVNGLRMLAWWGYRRAAGTTNDLRRWVNLQALGLLASGTMWGLAPWFFLDHAPEVGRIYVFATIVVMTFGTTVVNAPFRRARLAYCLPALGLGGVRALLEGGTQFVTVGVVLLVSIPIVVYYGAHWARLLRESLTMRHEKLALVEELTTQKARAEQANAAKSRFLAAASHDLRQPLHALTCYAALLDDPRRGAEVAPKVQACVHALGDMFDGILDLARLDSGTVEPRRHDFTFRGMVDRLRMLYTPLADEKRLGLRWRIDSSAACHSDPLLIERMVGNLLGNAICYTTIGGVLVVVRVRSGGVNLTVCDSGRGMSEEELARAFDEFVQFDNPARDAIRGHGIGLSTVQRLANLLGHTLRVRSRPGHGTCFELQLPLARGEPVPSTAEHANADASAQFTGRALVLDDHGPSREGIAELLTRWGFNCDTAATAAEAERLRSRRAYDAIVTDCRLPDDEDGLALACRWQQQHPTPRLLCVVSGEVSMPAVVPPGIDWLQKPVRPARLRALLTSRLEEDC